MFRKMRRYRQQICQEDCLKILREEGRGVLAMIGEDGYPYAIPLDFLYNEGNGRIYFHCAMQGFKLDLLRFNDKVCFSVMDKGFKREGDWSWNVRSLVIFGRVREISDPMMIEGQVRALGMKYYPTREGVELEMKKSLSRVCLLELTIDHMTGKLVNES
ncbi:putative 5-nitroimidazole antibiotic resistance protein NimB [Shuttleworthella sp. MSX8B]|uniref:pyridoxamine 5'-phosphate oxidase family protein n=1 Tax=Shuttleworthella sp. MSX8B TaxID=936574 RepID=UPI000446E56A|nr:pyridoxamine 5'-phosphate oxidase family protein [Shuttleworthia sp. MSX8B]EUB16261.1 putative 5-nitroimidazole antibiotic resistance protein NimB [Shuttleworthia sp. MSX8B]